MSKVSEWSQYVENEKRRGPISRQVEAHDRELGTVQNKLGKCAVCAVCKLCQVPTKQKTKNDTKPRNLKLAEGGYFFISGNNTSVDRTTKTTTEKSKASNVKSPSIRLAH
jgi:hypothetical protein